MKKVELSNGGVAIIDDEFFDFINQYRWYKNSKGYAITMKTTALSERRQVFMQHLVLGFTPHDGLVVDHINGVRLDNRKDNLRICTHAQNIMNGMGWKNRKSKYKGVYKRDGYDRWRVIISGNGERQHIGDFSSEAEAAKAYNDAAKVLHGEYARLNVL